MHTTGKWHQAKTYKFKRYTTKQCLRCGVKDKCSKAKYGKAIQRSEYQEYIDTNKKNIEKNQNYYRRRQAIVEHPYGTIKRQWGFSYIMTKRTMLRASSDVGFVIVAYNLRRIMNIIGIEVFKEYLIALYSKIASILAIIDEFSRKLIFPSPINTNKRMRLERIYLLNWSRI